MDSDKQPVSSVRIPAMNLVLDKLISLQFWRRVYPLDHAPGPTSPNPDFSNCAICKQDITRLLPAWITPDLIKAAGGRVDVLSTGASRRRQSSFRIVNSVHTPVPEGSFFQTTGGVYVASPMFIFLGMACALTIEQLIALGDEFCGTYSFDERSPRGFRKREKPLVDKARIARYLEGAAGFPGIKKAKRALPYVVEGSASPKETECEMLACLPYHLGGYGLIAFVMNYPVPLDEKARRVARRETCYIDLCYPELNFGFEFQGLYDHAGESSYDSDRARINGLKEMGYNIIELTNGQINDLIALEDLFVYAAKLSGKRIRRQNLGATPERVKLRQTIREWNQRRGMPSFTETGD